MPGWRLNHGVNEAADMTSIFGNSAVHRKRYTIQHLSITVVLVKKDTPEAWFTRLQEFWRQHFCTGFIGVEVGPRENLKVQNTKKLTLPEAPGHCISTLIQVCISGFSDHRCQHGRRALWKRRGSAQQKTPQ